MFEAHLARVEAERDDLASRLQGAEAARDEALARLESSEADRLAVEQAAAAEADRLLTERDVVIGRLEAQKAETQKALADREGLAADLRREKAEAEVARGHRRAIEAERDDLIRRLSEMGDGDFSTHYPDEPAGSAGPAVEALKAETARADALAADLAAARAQIEEMTQALAVTQFSLDILRPSIGVAPPSGTGPTPITSASRDRIDALTREARRGEEGDRPAPNGARLPRRGRPDGLVTRGAEASSPLRPRLFLSRRDSGRPGASG